MPIDEDVAPAIARIEAYLDRGPMSVSALARKAGVTQSNLARFMAGERKTITKSARRVLAVVDKADKVHKTHSHAIPSCIRHAVDEALSAAPESADVLASLIVALKPALAALAARG